jgi:hypothetical protein
VYTSIIISIKNQSTLVNKKFNMNMKKINNIWHICRDGWVYKVATRSEVISHVFNGLTVDSFEDSF